MPGVLLDRNLRRSVAWKKSQRDVANLISGSYTPDVVNRWYKMREDFDNVFSMPNPYEEVENCALFFPTSLTPLSPLPQSAQWRN